MPLLDMIGPAEASGEVKKLYASLLDSAGAVPPPLLLVSPSPGIQALQAQFMEYYQERSNLSPLLMTLLRYLTAVALEVAPCVEFNAGVLERLGFSPEQVAELASNPAAAPLQEKEGWLLAFAIKAVRAPDTVSAVHVDKLRDLGWTDSDLLEALYIPCMMVGMKALMKALKYE